MSEGMCIEEKEKKRERTTMIKHWRERETQRERERMNEGMNELRRWSRGHEVTRSRGHKVTWLHFPSLLVPVIRHAR